MKIYFAMLNPGYVRNFESAIRMLADRGHSVHLAFSQPWKQSEDGLAETLAHEYPSVTLGLAPKRDDAWSGMAWGIRCSMDYLRYLDPRFKDADRLRERALIWPLSRALSITDRPIIGSPPAARFFIGALRELEWTVPPSPSVAARIRSLDPDLLLLTPLVNMGSTQVDYLKCAHALGIRTALCVSSWDNLSNKGLIRLQPDRIVVWNEVQRRETIDLHGMDPASVIVTGAQRFDEWFGRKPGRTRDELCHRVGIDPDAPIILYVCSSPFIAEREVPFVRRWLGQLRAARSEPLQRAGVIVRPHPQNAAQWEAVDLSDLGNVALWPPGGANPVTEEAKTDYFDSLYHSLAVVGINTSALIEAGIVGRPVLTVLDPEFEGSQEGTLHFHYLAEASGGLLRVARSIDEHLNHLIQALDDPIGSAAAARKFVESFIRPHGLDVPCTPIFVQAIERLGALGTKPPVRAPLWSHPARIVLEPLAVAGSGVWARMKASGAQTQRMDLLRAAASPPPVATNGTHQVLGPGSEVVRKS